MKICLRCNLTYEDHQKFCKNCGQQLQNIDGDLNYNEQDNSQKKKKVKHIQVAYEIAPEIQKLLDEGNELTNERIKRVLKNRKSGQEV